MAVVVEVDGIGGPAPPPHLNSEGGGIARKLAVAEIAVERIALGVAAPRFIQRIRKGFTVYDLLPGGRVHVSDVKIRPAIAVFIEPASAHAGADIFDTGGGGDVAELTAFVFV